MYLFNRWFVGLLVVAATCGQSAMAQQGQQLIDSLKTSLTLKLPDTTRVHAYYDIANAFYKQSQFDSALAYLGPVLTISQKKKYWAGLGDYHRLKGTVRTYQGQYEDALTCYQQAIEQYNKVNKVQSIAKTYHSLGLLYKLMGDSQGVKAYTRQGIAYMQQAIAMNQRLKATKELRTNYINLGILYEDLGEIKQGRECFLKGLAPMNNTEVQPEDARIFYNNLGKNYNVEKDYQMAVQYLEKALAINLNLKRYSSLAHNYRNLATAHIGLKQPDKAVMFAEKSLEQLKRSGDAPLANSVYGTLSRAYAAAGQYQKAYEAAVKYKQIGDSLVNQAKTRTIAQLEGRYAVQQATEVASIKASAELAKTQAVAQVEANKAREIAAIQAAETRRLAQMKTVADIEKTRAILELQTQYDTQAKQRQIADLGSRNLEKTRQVEYMSGGLGLMAVLVSLLIGQYLIIRRSNQKLATQNGIITGNSQQLATQAEQLKTLMKELHHRVKNNLAIVSSLLSLQASNLQDEKAVQAVRVGQQRVEAMALIHQRLYQTDGITTINIRSYLTDLAQSLMYAYGYSDRDFDLVIDADEQELDVDVAIPLGLIANELITNAFKYAYAQSKHPRLRVGLHTQNGLTLEVQDNGPGIHPDDWLLRGGRPSFGKRLVASLSNQLDGQVEFIQQNGALCRLHIPEARLRAA
ncbi:tetratricopeptide repeat protein [Spirosoma rhododendri]|uniref:histidine kinase n=1 Tax=Spirosoma rhododendri TaxID=2728024 RepID=A0A7L5DSX3_9BACT|nr:tetratricopeptide repeat protein [Spirosoma rhododendri]QJD80373.1 tetratricopeptide repeat protein [Spirosoma rhododendri]